MGGVAAVIAAALVIGCGQGAGEPTALTKQTFLKQGNAICNKGRKEKDRLLEAGFKGLAANPSQKDLEGLVLDLLPPLEKTMAQLGELNPPREDGATVKAMLAEYDQALRLAKERPREVLSTNPFVEPDEAAVRYGLTFCKL